jgi:Na+/H+ antiporter NhaA
MIAPIIAMILAGAAWGTDSVPRLRGPAAPSDTLQAPAVEYSEWYGRRLTIHRWASYATLPLFAFQYAAGDQLYRKSVDAPEWAKRWHGPAATAIAVLFGVNTVTGGWNLYDARNDPEGRKWRTAHAVLMLAADAGFTATGMIAERAERSESARRQHRTIAVSSMAVATVSYLMMLPPFRRD